MPHEWERLPPAYVYLLGFYLGDGSIASHHRGVYRLRLTLDAAMAAGVDDHVWSLREIAALLD